MSNQTCPKILLVGWDAAGWDIVTPLLESGKLPNLARLLEKGVMGRMTSSRPIMERLTYTSLATGKYSDKHGILGTHEICQDGLGTRPVTNLSRRAKAFWEILSQNDIRNHVVHFQSPSPADEINGVFVGTSFIGQPPMTNWSPVAIPDGVVTPGRFRDTLQEFIVSMEDMDQQMLELFVPNLSKVPQRDNRISLLLRTIARSLSAHSIATWLMENEPWDVMTVNYPIIETVSREFLKYHPPKLDWIPDDEFEIFQHVMASAVQFCDLLLGRLIELAGKDATVIISSPRSYIPQHRVQKGAQKEGPHTEARLHRPSGIFVMSGPGTRHDELIHGVQEVDLCPTVLALCGLPVGEDMDGRARVDAMADVVSTEVIPTWETRGPSRPELPSEMTPVAWHEALAFDAPFTSHAAQWVQTQNEWNKAEAALGAGRFGAALPLLTRLYYTCPFRSDMVPFIAEALYVTGLMEEAINVGRNYAGIDAKSPTGLLMAGIVALYEGHEYEALDLLQAAAEDDPPLPRLYHYLGEISNRFGRLPLAAEQFGRALELDPNFLPSYIGLCQVRFQMGEYEAAADKALDALAVDFGFAPAHYLLGASFEAMGDREKALAAYGNALKVKGDFTMARARLDALNEGQRTAVVGLEDEAASHGTTLNVNPSQLRVAARVALQEVSTWMTQYTEVFAKADAKLNAYLAENRTISQDDTSSGQVIAMPTLDADGLIIRPVMPADLPGLISVVGPVFAEYPRHKVSVLQRLEDESVVGVFSLRRSDETGQQVSILTGPLAERDASESDKHTLWQALIRAGVVQAAVSGVQTVSYSLSPDGNEPMLDTLAQFGFEIKKHESVIEVDMAAMRDRCLRLFERAKAQGEVPDDLRIAQFEDVSMQAADQFFRGFFADGIGPRRADIHAGLSTAIMHGDTIVAAYSGYTEDDVWISPRLAVLEEYQSGWATPLLIGHGSKIGYEYGLRTIRLYADETVFPGMARIALRTGGKKVAQTCALALDLSTPWPEK